MSVRARECTGRGPGGVRLVSVAGPGALERVRALAPRAASRLQPGALVVVRMQAGEGSIDEVLVRVETDESIELGLHGGPAVVRRLLAELGADTQPRDARESLEGTARARVPSAASEAAARMLLDQAAGALRRGLDELAHASERDFAVRRVDLERRARWLEHARRPVRVVLAGPANAGKSTLFNLLAGRERVVVAPTPGTTRDAIAERVQLGVWPVELVDTAGEQPAPAGSVERAGQEVGRAERRAAALCFWLDPGDSEPAPRQPGEAPLVVLRSRCAEAERDPVGGHRIASVEDPLGTSSVVEACFRAALELPEDPWAPGAAVPFRPEQLDWLATLAACTPAERPARLAQLLERGSRVASESNLG